MSDGVYASRKSPAHVYLSMLHVALVPSNGRALLFWNLCNSNTSYSSPERIMPCALRYVHPPVSMQIAMLVPSLPHVHLSLSCLFALCSPPLTYRATRKRHLHFRIRASACGSVRTYLHFSARGLRTKGAGLGIFSAYVTRLFDHGDCGFTRQQCRQDTLIPAILVDSTSGLSIAALCAGG